MKEYLKSGIEISIIIPIYNAEPFLRACLDSVQNQTFPNFEVVLVNDGSTDGSRDICVSYCKKNKKFHLIEQINKGVSAARNYGLQNANGKYICFVDADDIISEDLLKIQYENIQVFNADIAICSYQKFENEINKLDNLNKTCILDKRRLFFDMSTTGPENKSESIVIVCNKLFRRKIVDGIMFPENMRHEDEYVIHQYIDKAKIIVATDKVLYYYRQHNESFMHNCINNDIDEHIDILKAYEHRLRMIKNYRDKELLHTVLISYIENATILLLLSNSESQQKKRKRIIMPKVLIKVVRYVYLLSVSEMKRYMTFLVSPQRYRRRYWK